MSNLKPKINPSSGIARYVGTTTFLTAYKIENIFRILKLLGISSTPIKWTEIVSFITRWEDRSSNE